MSDMLSKIWENIDGCADYYIRDTVLYLISQDVYVSIDRVISEPGHDREIVDGIDVNKKGFFYN